jgi:hypothetical protein
MVIVGGHDSAQGSELLQQIGQDGRCDFACAQPTFACTSHRHHVHAYEQQFNFRANMSAICRTTRTLQRPAVF